MPDGIEGEEVMAACKHCGADGSVCLWQEFHDGEAPCGATFDDDNGEDSAAPSKPSAAPEKQSRKINMIQSENLALAGVEGLAHDANSPMKSTEAPKGAAEKDRIDGKGISGERPAPIVISIKLTDDQTRVLRALDEGTYVDETAMPFLPLCKITGLTVDRVRASCRFLRRIGLATYMKGLSDDCSGEFRGAGYSITREGKNAVYPSASPEAKP